MVILQTVMSVTVEWHINRRPQYHGLVVSLMQVYNSKNAWKFSPMGIGVNPSPVYVYSHSFPFPLRLLFPSHRIPIPTGNTIPIAISSIQHA